MCVPDTRSFIEAQFMIYLFENFMSQKIKILAKHILQNLLLLFETVFKKIQSKRAFFFLITNRTPIVF